jgi:hypothetical protein
MRASQPLRRDAAPNLKPAMQRQIAACVAGFDLCHIFRRAGGHDLAPAIAAFGADVDDPVGGFDHIQVVFDHDHGIALFHEFVQHVQQLAHIFEMQPRGRFIQDIQRAARGAAAELLGQFHPLRLTARQRRGLLANLDVAKPHLHQRIHLLAYRRNSLEKALGIFNRHIKNIGDAFVLEFYFQSLAVIACPCRSHR